MLMKPVVIYFSKSGNTKKVAQEIAGALKTEALDVKKTSAKDVPKGAFLIAGSGVYGSKVGREMMDFLQSLPAVKRGKAATFETSGNGKEIAVGKEMGDILKKRGYSVKGSFVCPGKCFFFAKRGHPSAEDLKNAAAFAKGLSSK
jgi:flavodoxin